LEAGRVGVHGKEGVRHFVIGAILTPENKMLSPLLALIRIIVHSQGF
jgi:hypothetical protein